MITREHVELAECNLRYNKITNEMAWVTTWIKIITWITWICFIVIMSITWAIFDKLWKIEVVLNEHKLSTMKEVTELKWRVLNLEISKK